MLIKMSAKTLQFNKPSQGQVGVNNPLQDNLRIRREVRSTI